MRTVLIRHLKSAFRKDGFSRMPLCGSRMVFVCKAEMRVSGIVESIRDLQKFGFVLVEIFQMAFWLQADIFVCGPSFRVCITRGLYFHLRACFLHGSGVSIAS